MRDLPNDFYDDFEPASSKLITSVTNRLYITAKVFSDEVAEFFSVYDKCPFTKEDTSRNMNKIFISPIGFSFIVKRIANLLSSPENMKVRISLDSTRLYVSFELFCDCIPDMAFQDMRLVASISGFAMTLRENTITLSSEIISSELVSIYAGKGKPVYSSLRDALLKRKYLT